MLEDPIDLLIDHQCPQCGAPAVLAETDRLYACDYCKVKSYLIPRDVLRYQLPHRTPAGRPLTYVPYWRFKGMVFACGEAGLTHRFMDVSHCALDHDGLPASLGLRSQALHLRFVTPESTGRFLLPTRGRREAVELFARQAAARFPPPIHMQAQIGESLSLIYAPVYQTDRLHDAVLDRPLSIKSGPDLDTLAGGAAEGRFQFVTAICSHCGWDLEGQRDSLVLLCRNCDRVWQASPKGLQTTRMAHLPAASAGSRAESIVYLPFWRIKARVHGLPLASYADLVRLANLPLVPKPAFETRPFRFWSLAFKVRPNTFLNLARNLTLAQPEPTLTEQIPRGELFPVNLPVGEAVESLMPVLAAFAKPAHRIHPRLSEIAIVPEAALLVYIPFAVGHHEYLQPTLKLSVNKSQLALAGNL